MQELLKYIVQALVDNPEKVALTVKEGSQTIVFELKVAKEDLGKVIGKQGRNARAIRTVLGAVAAKHKKRAVLEILE
ncbi:MAG: KH domain-containing protein [Desulfobacterales bacterium]|nr:MAG: KH domain-containing protein [Desulfobacterales bacterium]